VLNKAERGTGIDIGRLQRVYPQGFTAVLPYASEVTRSINRGQPVIVTSPEADIARRFIEGASRLVAPAEGAEIVWSSNERRPGLFAKLFGRRTARRAPDERKARSSPRDDRTAQSAPQEKKENLR
jgi:septum formation inhibitor-activating ATPase MinD